MGACEYQEFYTYDDYVHWEGDWELIYGQAIAMAPSPMIDHQAIATQITIQLGNSIEECKKCIVISEQDYKVSDDTVIRPDVAMICDEPNKNYITKPPKIVVEVISKATARRDERVKFEIYEREKVAYYVIVYPSDLKAKVYKLENHKYQKVDDFSCEKMCFDDLECKASIDFAKVFAKFRDRD